MAARKLRFASALTSDGWADDVCIDVDAEGMIAAMTPNSRAGDLFSGIAIPAMPNVHSHAHQRFMQGLAERAGPGTDSFWTWRETMYGFALKLSPEDMEAVAAQAYVEMLKAGFSIAGEFQYLHHQPDGSPYVEPAEMSLRCLAAAEHAGIAITLLPALYAHGGFGGQPPLRGQRRFINGADRFLAILETLQSACDASPLRRLGIAPHSLRAVSRDLLSTVLEGLPASAPIHIHVAEQMKEVEDCLAWCGKRPVELLLDSFDLSSRWCAIHATHMTDEEATGLVKSGAVAGLCPTTEANLGDGIFPATDFVAAGGVIAIGSDSHITISVAEDLRMLEYSQRLRDHTRNALATRPGASTGRSLFNATLKGGAQSMAQPVGALAPGLRADICVLDGDHPALAGRARDAVLDSWIFSGGNALAKGMFVAGAEVVKDGVHIREDDIATRFRSAVKRLA